MSEQRQSGRLPHQGGIWHPTDDPEDCVIVTGTSGDIVFYQAPPDADRGRGVPWNNATNLNDFTRYFTPHGDAPQEVGQPTAETATRPDESLREKLIYFVEYGVTHKKDSVERRAEAARLVDEYAHELADRARRGVDVLEGHVGGFQHSRDVREILDVVDPATPDPEGWDF